MPKQVAPETNAKNVARNPQFKWKAVEGAVAYELHASHNSKMVLNKQVKGTSFTASKAWSAKTTYYWRVRAIKNGNKGKWSKIRALTTGTKVDSSAWVNLAVPKQTAPKNNAKNIARKPQFKWKAVDGAEAYELDVSHGDKTVLHKQVKGTSFTPGKAWSANKTYHWHVRAIKNGTKGKWSKTWDFTTGTKVDSSAGANLAVPKQAAPKNNAKNIARKPQFKWKAVDGAEAYVLDVSHGDKTVLDKQVKGTSFTPGKAWSANKTYHWHVRAIKNGTKGKWSKTWDFTTQSVEIAAPKLEAPKSNAKNVALKPQFKWKAVDGADAYELGVSHDHKNVLDKQVKDTSFTAGKGWPANETYHWHVRAIKNGTKGKWSETWQFTTSLAAPKLVAPKDNAKNVARKPQFKWKAVDGADAYVLDAIHNSKKVLHKQVKGTSFTPSKAWSGSKTYNWHVRAIKNGTNGKWSETHSFITQSAADASNSGNSVASSDRKALMVLYKATGGSNWTHNSGWGSNASLNSWYGIKADAQGHVTKIDLWHNNLTGKIENVPWGTLNKVKYMNIKYNHLTGSIPSSIGSMSSMVELILQGRDDHVGAGTAVKQPPSNLDHAYHPGKVYSNTNDFSGTIPASIGNLSNLEILEIANAEHIKGPLPQTMGNLTNLKGLYLSGDDFRGYSIPNWICNFTNLKMIQMAGTGIGGNIPKCFGNLTQLTDIQFGEFDHNHTFVNQITGTIPDLSHLTELRRIIFDRNKLTGKFPHYWNNGNFTHLLVLRFTFNNLTGTLPDFNNLPNLGSFAVDGNKMTGSIKPLTTLPAGIHIIGVGWNNFSGEFPQSGWPDFDALKTIYLSHNAITGSIPCSFWDKLDNPDLNWVYVDYDQLSDVCESHAKQMVGRNPLKHLALNPQN